MTPREKRTLVDSVRSCLAAATEAIQDDYYLLPMQGTDPAYRERTYCYELYHQMKAHWPPELRDAKYDLGGEVDKTGHRWFQHQILRDRKPDLLVHDPGEMAKNLVVIEVKSVAARRSQIKNDLEKLTAFCGRGRYVRGFYLLYGYERHEVARILRVSAELAARGPEIDLTSTDPYWHAGPRQAARLLAWPRLA